VAFSKSFSSLHGGLRGLRAAPDRFALVSFQNSWAQLVGKSNKTVKVNETIACITEQKQVVAAQFHYTISWLKIKKRKKPKVISNITFARFFLVDVDGCEGQTLTPSFCNIQPHECTKTEIPVFEKFLA